MARRRTVVRQRAWGEAIVERLNEAYVPAELGRYVRAFKAAQTALAAATKRASVARTRRDAALNELARAEGVLERALHALGKRLAASGMGTRKNPLAGRSTMTPAQIAELAPDAEITEALRVVASFKGARVGPPVRRAVDACRAAASALRAAWSKVSDAQAAYARSVAQRDSLLGAWTTSLARLERHAREAWADDAETLARIFAPLDDDEPREGLDLRIPLPNVMNGVHTS